jgi:YrbI family 3-deoxy-D-manno-octulosonate 8-phosphate phosphatase
MKEKLINKKITSPKEEIANKIKLVVFDFDGVFTDNRVFVFQDGTEAVLCSRADGLGIEALRRKGVKVLVISTEKNPVVKARCQKLNILCIQGADNKARILKEEASKIKIPLAETAYLANDINDLECLAIVGLPACVADSNPEVINISKYKTRAKGGYGAVREFCDYLVKLKSL